MLSGEADLQEIPEVKIRRTGAGPNLGDVVRHILRESPLVGARNIHELSDRLGLGYTTVRDWYKKGTAPNLETLSEICEKLGTDVVNFFLQYPEFTHTMRSPYRAIFDQMASIVHKPESAAKLLAVLREQAKLGLLDSFIDMKAAEFGVDPDYSVRSLERSAPTRKKSRKGA